jgi:hypothetical protein
MSICGATPFAVVARSKGNPLVVSTHQFWHAVDHIPQNSPSNTRIAFGKHNNDVLLVWPGIRRYQILSMNEAIDKGISIAQEA